MKTIFTYPIILLFYLVNILNLQATYSQSGETKKILAEIEGKWQKDANGNVTYTKVIENINLPKDSIYRRALTYCTYSYNDGSSLIQDKSKGLIVHNGIYEKTFHRISPVPAIIPVMEELVNTHYEIRIKIKDNGAQILLTLTDYSCFTAAGMNSSTNKKYSVSSSFPVNQEGNKKNKFGKAFYESHQRGQQSFIEIENALRKGYTVEDYKKGLNDQKFKKYYGNGNMKMIGFKNKNGNITGELKYYYKNGQLRGIGNAVNGLFTGEWIYYHENGQLERIGNYLKNKPSGEWKYYDETGKLIKTENYN